MKRVFGLIALVVLLAFFTYAADKERWINVHVTEAKDNTNVDIRVPFALLATAVDCIDAGPLQKGKVKLEHLGQQDCRVDFKRLWAELRKHDNTDFVKVESDKEKVTISRKGELFLIEVFEKGEKQANVLVKIPVQLMDALASSDTNEIDLKALLAQMANMPAGDLVLVHEKGTDVRIWIE